MAEAVHRYIKGKEAFDHTGKQVGTGPDELLFIEFNINFKAARERDAIFRDKPGEVTLAGNGRDADDLFLKRGRIFEVVETEDLLEAVLAVFDER